jgi:hypothetical protein
MRALRAPRSLLLAFALGASLLGAAACNAILGIGAPVIIGTGGSGGGTTSASSTASSSGPSTTSSTSASSSSTASSASTSSGTGDAGCPSGGHPLLLDGGLDDCPSGTANCGFCGHTCTGVETCGLGLCLAETVAAPPVDAGSAISQLAADTSAVFFVYYTSGNLVASTPTSPLDAGATMLLASSPHPIGRLAWDAAHVYFPTDGDLWQADREAKVGASVLVTDDAGTAVAVGAFSGVLYANYARPPPGDGFFAHSQDLTKVGPPQIVVAPLPASRDLAVLGSHVFFSYAGEAFDGGDREGGVDSFDVGSATTTNVASAPSSDMLGPIAPWARFIYWSTLRGVWRADTTMAGAVPELLWSSVAGDAGASVGPAAIAADDWGIYIADPASGIVYEIPMRGCDYPLSDAKPLTPTVPNLQNLVAIDDTYAYYADRTTVYRVSK